MFSFKDSPFLIRKLNTSTSEIYLTFDDGPDPSSTPAVMDVLREEGALASFFVIGNLARKNPGLIDRMIQEGHSVFSHSIDHRYRHYFRGQAKLQKWLTESLIDLELQTKLKQKAFRPPAGVLTPPLIRASQELGVPLILWTHRFFDSNRPWLESVARENAAKICAGEIVLLHDAQKSKYLPVFVRTLRFYLHEIKKRGFLSSPLTLPLIETEVLNAQYARHANSSQRDLNASPRG